jgi:hypothetical protein
MHRRGFLKGGLVGAAVLRSAAQPAVAQMEARPPKATMKAGHQHHSSDADLRLLAALGVNHICSALPSRTFDESWSVDGLSRLRERVELPRPLRSGTAQGGRSQPATLLPDAR